MKPPAAKWWPSSPWPFKSLDPRWILPLNSALPHTGRHSLKQGSSSQFLTPTLRKDSLRNSSARVALRERWWSEHVPIIYPFWVVSLLTICGGSHGFTLKEKQPILLYTLTFECKCVKIWIFRCSTVGFTDASSKVMLKSKLCQGIDLMFSLWLLKHGWKKKKHGANFDEFCKWCSFQKWINHEKPGSFPLPGLTSGIRASVLPGIASTTRMGHFTIWRCKSWGVPQIIQKSTILVLNATVLGIQLKKPHVTYTLVYLGIPRYLSFDTSS